MINGIIKAAERVIPAPIVVVHGSPGIGKTTFAASAPSPIFICTEDGLANNSVDSFSIATSFNEVINNMGMLYTENHDYKTVIIDSLSALEPMIWQQVATDNNASNVEAIGYGKGYVLATDYWFQFLQGIIALRSKGMLPVLIAHSEIVRYEAPDSEPYDRYQIKLHKRAFHLLYERADIIGFAYAKPILERIGDAPTIKEQQKGVKGKYRAVTTSNRSLFLVEKPSFIAKNRYGFPDYIPLSWEAFNEQINKINTNQPTNQ